MQDILLLDAIAIQSKRFIYLFPVSKDRYKSVIKYPFSECFAGKIRLIIN